MEYLSKKHKKSRKLLCGKVSVGFVDALTSGGDSEGFVFAETSVVNGTITFSSSSIEGKLRDETESIYLIENEYLQDWVGKRGSKYHKEHHLFWIVLHEFCHLFVGCNNDRHDHEFFEMVAELAKDCSFLFDLQ